jgi:hypothetical protein
VGKGCDTRSIDDYLWLTGMYMRWKKNEKKKNPKVNSELINLFTNKNQSMSVLRLQLWPDGLPS